jgi:hypothetical protein
VSRKACSEAIRLAGALGVTTAEGFLRLPEYRRNSIVELSRMRGRTHPLKEVEIMLGTAVQRLDESGAGDRAAAHELFRDATYEFMRYFNLAGFDHTGRAPAWFSEAEDGIALGLQPPSKRKPCRPGVCACDMNYVE